MSEMGATTYYVPEGAPPSATPTIAYQSQPPGPYWNQATVSFYPSAAQPQSQAPAQRFSVQMQPTQGQTAYVPATAYPVNYVATQQAPAQPPNAEVVSVYPNQQVQMVYQSGQPNGTAVVYQNQPLIYTHNPLYQNGKWNYSKHCRLQKITLIVYDSLYDPTNSCLPSRGGHTERNTPVHAFNAV